MGRASPSREYEGTWFGMPLKHVALVTLTIQNTVLILILHYSRIMPLIAGQRYITSTAVFMNEILKLSVNLTAALADQARTLSPSKPATALFSDVMASVFTGDSWKLAVPACLYVLQNSLQYIALSNLDSATYQVTCQLKILPTAIFSVFLLDRSLSLRKWISLALLMIGVAIVQLPVSDPAIAPFKNSQTYYHWPRSVSDFWSLGSVNAHPINKRSATYEGIAEDEGLLNPSMNPALGLAAAIGGTISASAASVYFEKILKDSETQASLWIRNVQLSFYSLFPALFLGVMFVDGEEVAQHGFFVGYNWIVWVTIGLQSLGGVLVSLAVKYADNITKSFAISISVLLSLIASVFFFDFVVTKNFVMGTSVVLFSTYLYNSGLHGSRNDRAPRPGPIHIHDYEKITIDKQRSEGNLGPVRLPVTPLKSSGLSSSSRPGSPGIDSQSRRGTSRQHYFSEKHAED